MGMFKGLLKRLAIPTTMKEFDQVRDLGAEREEELLNKKSEFSESFEQHNTNHNDLSQYHDGDNLILDTKYVQHDSVGTEYAELADIGPDLENIRPKIGGNKEQLNGQETVTPIASNLLMGVSLAEAICYADSTGISNETLAILLNAEVTYIKEVVRQAKEAHLYDELSEKAKPYLQGVFNNDRHSKTP